MPCKKMNIVAPKIDPGGESMGGIRRLAMVSLRAGFSPFFLCLRASRPVLAPPPKSLQENRLYARNSFDRDRTVGVGWCCNAKT